MIRYTFNEEKVLSIQNKDKADPQKIGKALEEISEKVGGHLTPRAVVDAARDRKNALHVHFEWDDKLAAESYRITQARDIIQAIHIVSDSVPSGYARAFLSISDKSGTSYRTLEEVMSSADLQSRILAQAERDLISFETRYSELQDICGIVRKAREKVASKRIKHENRAVA